MMSFDVKQLRASLAPLDNIGDESVISDEAAKYLAYYHIDFVKQGLADTYALGRVDIHPYRIATHFWQVKGATNTAVIVHGYYDHTGLYGHLIRFCLEQGMNVLMWDQPGHGLSTGEQADIDSFQTYDAVFEHQLTLFKQNFDTHNLFLFGQSTGGAVLINYLLKRSLHRGNSSFARVVLLAPLVLPIGWRIGRWLLPVVSLFTQKLTRKFSHSSSDPEFMPFVRDQDPLQSRYLKLGWVKAMGRWYQFLQQQRQCEHPVLCLQGTADQTVDWSYNMRFLKDKFTHIEVNLLADVRHHMVNEEQAKRASVFDLIKRYLDAQ